MELSDDKRLVSDYASEQDREYSKSLLRGWCKRCGHDSETLEEVRKELEENESFQSYPETFCQMDVERYFSGGNDEEIPEKYRNEARKILMYHFSEEQISASENAS